MKHFLCFVWKFPCFSELKVERFFSLLTQHRYRFVNPCITRGPYFSFFFCGQPTCRFPCLRESAGDDPPEAADVNAPQQQKKKTTKKMEENCVELILFGDSGHFVLTSILQIIALCWLFNFKYAAKYQVKSLKSGPTGNLTSKKLK